MAITVHLEKFSVSVDRNVFSPLDSKDIPFNLIVATATGTVDDSAPVTIQYEKGLFYYTDSGLFPSVVTFIDIAIDDDGVSRDISSLLRCLLCGGTLFTRHGIHEEFVRVPRHLSKIPSSLLMPFIFWKLVRHLRNSKN